VVHQHNPPREFAYFRTASGVQKAFTQTEFKLNFIFTSRTKEPVVLTDIDCVTRSYRALTDERVLILVKPKGIFEPETVRFAPTIASGSEVHLLGGDFFRVHGHRVEVLCAELLTETTAGIYELEFRATLATGERLEAPRMSLVVSEEDVSTCRLLVAGKHNDSVAPRILDLSDQSWSTLCNTPPDTVRILGPSLTEIAHETPAPEHWQVRESQVRKEEDSGALYYDEQTLEEVLTLEGPISEELYGLEDAKARVESREGPEHVLIPEQIRRRQTLMKD
jgi:hypothetical protein